MEFLIHFFILLPILTFLVSLIIPEQKEKMLSIVTYSSVGVQIVLVFVFFFGWIFTGYTSINLKEFSIFQSSNYDFFIDFYVDNVSVTYLIFGTLLMFIVTIYSRYYLHREVGYKRFFNITLLFYLGYTITVLSGNLETLFIGWEFMGVSSFLLIGFYRNRYLPVKNAVKVFSIYRIGDVGIILTMWLSHHFWNENISFYKLSNYELVHDTLAQHSVMGLAISFLIFIAAAAKSAQFPFSSWLPRAMEGPTPSSAIFYGSMSVHMGVFIMLRTFPFWENQFSFRFFVVVIGITTAIIATFTARVQASIKSQIAYSSIAQIGLIFIEISLGLEILALIHTAGNAFLRTYQLLVSPSIVAYKIREQQFTELKVQKAKNKWSKKWEYSIYILSLKEWNLDSILFQYLWNPLKKVGSKWTFLNFKNIYFFFLFFLFLGMFFIAFPQYLNPSWKFYFPLLYGFLGLMSVIKAFTERNSVRLAWSLIIVNHFFIALAISFNHKFHLIHLLIYISGVIASGLVGYGCIQRFRSLEQRVSLDRFYGHVQTHPKIALLFLLASLGLAGFPITPTFIGEDLIFSHIHEDQILLATFVSLSLIINGLAAIRIYARIFLGPHSKQQLLASNKTN